MRSYLVAWVLIIFRCDYIKSDILFENLTEIIEEIQKKLFHPIHKIKTTLFDLLYYQRIAMFNKNQ